MHEHCEKFSLGGLHLRIVSAVNHENNRVSVCIVGIPGGSQVLLTAEIPYLKAQILVLHFFNITSNRWLGHDYFIEGQLVQNSGLACIVHANDYDFELHVPTAQATQSIPD